MKTEVKYLLIFPILLVLVRQGMTPAYAADDPPVPKALAEARVNAARKAYQETDTLYREGRIRDVDRVYLWSQRWLESERDLSSKKADQVAAFEAHWKRMKNLEESVRKRYKVGAAAAIELPAVEYYRLEAEVWLVKAKAK
jgi:hypothetical protein